MPPSNPMPAAGLHNPGAIREPADFADACCVSASATGVSSRSTTLAGGSRTDPRVQTNWTILACAAEKRQTKAG